MTATDLEKEILILEKVVGEFTGQDYLRVLFAKLTKAESVSLDKYIALIELNVLKRWLADRKALEDELEKQANWIADNHRLISTLNEDRDRSLDIIKALEAENERLKKKNDLEAKKDG